MDLTLERRARINSPWSPKGFEVIKLKPATYTNNLDHCFLQDFWEDEIDQSAKEEREKNRGIVVVLGGGMGKKGMESMLNSIYKIQSTPQASKEFVSVVDKEFPFLARHGWDITSPDFLKELWFTGELLEEALNSGVTCLSLPEILTRKVEYNQ